MAETAEDKTGAPEADEYDLSTERLLCPEINGSWWPHSTPTDGVAHKRQIAAPSIPLK